MYKEIITKDSNVEGLVKGLNILADLVGSTLGPKGRNVIIQKPYGMPHLTKDGVSVAKEVNLEGIEGIGTKLLQEVANKSGEQAGDGTTTATVLAREIAVKGFRLVQSGTPAMELKRGVDQAVKDIIAELEKVSLDVKSLDELFNIALVSSNGDKEIAKLIRDAFEKAGDDGVIIVDDSKSNDTYLDYTDGLKIDKGLKNPLFINVPDKQCMEYEKPAILMFSGVLDSIPLFAQLLNSHGDKLMAKPLIVMAEKFSPEILGILVGNKVQQGIRLAAIEYQGYGDKLLDNMRDLAAICGATIISEEDGNSVEKFDESWLGSCDKIISNMDFTTFVGGKAIPEVLEAAKANVKGLMETAKSQFDKDRYQKRLCSLSSKLVIVRVGGTTDIEVKEVKDRIDDALCATKAANKEGILPGGGVALLRASSTLKQTESKLSTRGESIGYQLLLESLEAPLRTLCDNAGLKSDYIVAKVMSLEGNMGYNIRTDEYVDMLETGIIDPTKVVKCSLLNAASVATLIFTSSGTILQKPEVKECNCKN